MDAPLAQVAELGAGAAGVVAGTLRMLHVGADVVRRHLAVAMAGRGDLEHGAADQRVFELARRAHRIARNGAVVGGDEVHQPEAEALHLDQRGDVEDLFERGMCLNQHMNRDVPGNAGTARHMVDVIGHPGDFHYIGHLRYHHIGQARAGGGHQDVDVLAPVRVGGVVDAHAHTVVDVLRAVDQLGAQRGVLALEADGGAVLAVECDVEHGPKLLLQGQRLAHELFAAGIVVTHRQLDRDGFALKQDLGRMHVEYLWSGG
ncbi:hypothetical protein D3C87_1463350 [compost metagenome]